MYQANMTFVDNNPVMMTIFLLGGLVTWWGFFKGTVKPWIIASLVVTVLVFTSSAFLYVYCKLSGVNVETIDSYNTPLIASVVFWLTIATFVLAYLERKDKQQEINNVAEKS